VERIDLHNYEAFLLDFCEGILSPELVSELQAFLVLHPELEIDLADLNLPSLTVDNSLEVNHSELLKEFDPTTERVLNYLEGLLKEEDLEIFESDLARDPSLKSLLAEFQSTRLIAETIEFPKREMLLQTEDGIVFGNLALNFMEGQLSEKEAKEVALQLQQDVLLANELAAFRATKLSPDQTIVFPDKAALLRSGKVIALFSGNRAYYAAAAVLLMLIFAFLFQANDTNLNTLGSLASTQKKVDTTLSTEVPSLSKMMTAPVQPTKANKINHHNEIPQNTNVPVMPRIQAQELPIVQENIVNPTLTQLPKESPENSALKDQDQSPQPVASTTAISNTVYSSVNDLAVTDDLPEIKLQRKKTDLWHKAVDLARRANHLGFTAVKGEEETMAKSYRLSFNSFSVEKR
jgi:hypothetical protein